MGGSRFNETGTHAPTDDPATIEAIRLMHKWMFVDRLLPTFADRQSFTVDAGYAGANPQLFDNNLQPERGQIAMMWGGRYHLIIFRELDRVRRNAGRPPFDYGIAEPPHGGFPNTTIATRAVMVYAGGRHKDLAVYFLAYLASREYNMQIVADGDSLPPNPQFSTIEEFSRPTQYPNEWGLHDAFATAARELAIGRSYSPFILHATADRIEMNNLDKHLQPTPLAGYTTAEQTAHRMNAEINAEMRRTIRENPALLPLYERLLVQQARIDDMKARILERQSQGQPIPDDLRIPAELIENPFHLAYYARKGWLRSTDE
jgi:multiple sugar transport system substrate-binding protein